MSPRIFQGLTKLWEDIKVMYKVLQTSATRMKSKVWIEKKKP
jgi:hypothetical protein